MDLQRLLSKRARIGSYIAYAIVMGAITAAMLVNALDTGSWHAFAGWIMVPLIPLIPLAWLHFEVSYRLSQRKRRN